MERETSLPPRESCRRDPVLEVCGLTVRARDSRTGEYSTLVRELSFEVRRGCVTALVGESGSGKSTACLSIPRLLDPNVEITAGTIVLEGTDLASLSLRQMRTVRGNRIGMVFQDPLSALNPVRRIGAQLGEARRRHGSHSRRAVREWSTRMLGSLGFAEPEQALRSYPVAFSGGMRQRVCVGIAFSADPQLVIADEPTTSLDISLQGRLLRLLMEQCEQHDTSLILVSHDVSVVRAVADRVVVMYGGRALEDGPADRVLRRPANPYTHALMMAVPRMDPQQRAAPLPTIEAGTGESADSDGCPFVARCPNALDICRKEFPQATQVAGDPDHRVWCFNPVTEDAAPVEARTPQTNGTSA